MKMSVHVTNGNLDEAIFNEFCFGLLMARPSGERTEIGVLFADIPADAPYYMPSHHPPFVTTEMFFRWHIRNICERTASLLSWPPMLKGSYALTISYTDIQPSLFCEDMRTKMTEGYPVCERMDCAKNDVCPYTSKQEGGR